MIHIHMNLWRAAWVGTLMVALSACSFEYTEPDTTETGNGTHTTGENGNHNGNGNGNGNGNSNGGGTQTISIVSCTSSTDFHHYTPLQSGDVIRKERSGTAIRLYHSRDDHKWVCVKTGKAYVARP